MFYNSIGYASPEGYHSNTSNHCERSDAGHVCISIHLSINNCLLLPARASEHGNVIGSVCIYIAMCEQKKIVIERTRDLIYLKFVATDFFPKIISPSAGENSGDLA